MKSVDYFLDVLEESKEQPILAMSPNVTYKEVYDVVQNILKMQRDGVICEDTIDMMYRPLLVLGIISKRMLKGFNKITDKFDSAILKRILTAKVLKVAKVLENTGVSDQTPFVTKQFTLMVDSMAMVGGSIAKKTPQVTDDIKKVVNELSKVAKFDRRKFGLDN